MSHSARLLPSSLLALGIAALVVFSPMAAPNPPAASFGADLAFLKQHTPVIALSDVSGQAQVAVAPAWQGRVMTSTAGGEDRFWLGPEGGQFSIFFAKGVAFDLAHWFTPAPIDTDAYQVVRQGRDAAAFRHAFELTNYSGTRFSVQADREVRLLAPAAAWKQLGLDPKAGVTMVAYESVNRITNTGQKAWVKDTGLLSIWILGMFTPSPATTIVVPFKPGPDAALGKPVNAAYFGAVPPERLVVKDRVAFFSGDGRYRSKIGIGPRRAMPTLGSYDAAGNVLTLVQYTLPPQPAPYVNSMWEIQKDPYGGEVVNSYNDGPPSPGAKPLGPFYEIESSSPAAALAPAASLEHVHRTLHLTGSKDALDAIARATLGVGLAEIVIALPKTK